MAEVDYDAVAAHMKFERDPGSMTDADVRALHDFPDLRTKATLARDAVRRLEFNPELLTEADVRALRQHPQQAERARAAINQVRAERARSVAASRLIDWHSVAEASASVVEPLLKTRQSTIDSLQAILAAHRVLGR